MLRGLVCAVLLLAGGTAEARLKVGESAPPFVIRTFGKADVASATLAGRVVIVNRWATWCGPCRQELPELDAYYRAHAAQGLSVFAITTEDSAPTRALKPLAAMLAFPLALSIRGAAFPDLGALPTNYVLDRHGVVRYAKAGAFDAETLAEVVTPLLAEP